MTRNFKTLGLALVAVFAMSAVMASAASAVGHFEKAGGGATVITGEQPVGAPHVFTAGAHGEVKCEVAHFEGTTSLTKSNELTITPKYTSCTFKGIKGTIVDVNGCKYLFTGTSGQAHLQCTGETKSITITAITAGVLKCTIHIAPQTLGGISYTNVNAHPGNTSKVNVVANVTGIKYSTTAGIGAGACTATAAGADGTYKGSVEVSGKTGGVAEGIWVT